MCLQLGLRRLESFFLSVYHLGRKRSTAFTLSLLHDKAHLARRLRFKTMSHLSVRTMRLMRKSEEG